jgi:hypothetical protein
VSEAGYTKDEHYKFLLDFFPGNIIHIRSNALWNDIVKVLEGSGHDEKVRIDEETFQMVIIDYFTDVARIKDFHLIEKINVNKIYGYGLYWFLRRKPIQILEPFADYFDINEKVAIGVFLPKILKEAGITYTQNTQDEQLRKRMATFVNLLFYNLKYRLYTPQSLELMIEAFLCGCEISRIKFSNGQQRK